MKVTPFCTIFLAVFEDIMLKILLVCAFVSIIVDTATAHPDDRGHSWYEVGAILLAVAVVSIVGAGSDYKKEIQFIKNA